MIKFFNFILVAAVLAAATLMYSLEHNTRGLEREIAQLNRKIEGEKERAKLLNAEWSSLTRPERIEMLARTKLQLEPVKATQILRAGDIHSHLPPRQAANDQTSATDPIGNMIQNVQ